MQGRIKRKRSLREVEEQAARGAREGEVLCVLCQRRLGTRVEWHHRVPKSKGGNETVPVHPICHRAIHATVSNHELAGTYADLEELRAREDMQRFLRWIANKPANFNAPIRQRRD